ncbi:hypothetical protein HG535_0A03010 [Zygotorulaspora mrakii]|uniref:Glycosyltransferase family 15 protein n=1 Tax=Zygotorulaspora mrakii TaxID=42260 RepID=A0A7H9AXR0_ZYGMR|nr:uncharacterized protein HG535_0A03010 [Zygotorulaspora mrakii]QLG70362.1 hypothetical protein HG535_0A03010 [Zygotorulaspora mrakii]
MLRDKIPSGKERLYKTIGLAVVALITIFVILNNTGVTSSNGLISSITSSVTTQDSKTADGLKQPAPVSPKKYSGHKEKATFVTLARNRDLYSLLPAIRSVEDRFNRKFNYDWVFLNDEEFSEEFKRVTTALISGTTKYGVIPKEQWQLPDFIDKEKAANTRKEMAEKGIIYGDSIPYRYMCRYESGFFYRHELMADYEYYWRVEPDVKLYCDIDYDVFRFMKKNDKKYAFTISIKEYAETIKTLWETTREFITSHQEYINKNNMLDFISDDEGYSYNLCHFWSNFEIASLDLWRSDAYTAYFDHLDKSGGFFYERWGDAPIHSIAAALFLDRNQIHHFDNIGYYHPPFHSCSVDEDVRMKNKCDCNPADDFTWKSYSCTTKFYTVNGLTKPKNWQIYAD